MNPFKWGPVDWILAVATLIALVVLLSMTAITGYRNLVHL